MADGNVTCINADVARRFAMHRTETVGRAHPHVEVGIADPETGATIERGETGEFVLEDMVMSGYWNDR